MKPLSQRKAIAVFMVFAFAYFISTLIRAITATLAPTLVTEFTLNARDLGLLAGGYFFGFALTQLPLGKLLDRHGPKRVILGFLSVAVMGTLAFSQAPNFGWLLAARVLCGVGVSACLMAPLTGFRRWYAPANLMRANSWMLMAGAMGMVASTLPVQWLISVIGWRPLFMVLGVMVVMAMAMIFWQVPAWQAAQSSAGDTPSAVAPGYGEIWRDPYFRRMVPLGFFNYGGMVAMQTLWAAPWMVKVAGYTPAQAAMGLFWINICMLLAFLIWGSLNPTLARKGYGTNRMVALGIPVTFVVLAIIMIAGTALSTWAGAAWVLYCVSSTVGAQIQPAVGMAFRAELAGRGLSAFNLVIFAGVFSVQWGIGLLIDGFRALGWMEVAAYQGALGVFGLCCVGAYLYFLAAKKT
ncbi:MAG: MFS transporter [Burkholderiales bacterium]|nr:MFS transporter [Burkholderiales bacterium]